MRYLYILTFLFSVTFSNATETSQKSWIATWGTSPAPQLKSAAEIIEAHFEFEDQTLRQIVHTSVAGETIRLKLSNAYGTQAIVLDSVHIARQLQDSTIISESDHCVTFNGNSRVVIPADAIILSDPLSFKLPADKNVIISIHILSKVRAAGIHYASSQTAYLGKGDQTSSPIFKSNLSFTSWIFLTGLEVLAPAQASTLVAFGDSITDGSHSTVDQNKRWPNILAKRLLERGGSVIGVVDAGIGGNRILHDPIQRVAFGVNALARFERDVLSQPNVKYIIVLEGINDIGHPGHTAPISEEVSVDDLIGAYKQMIQRAHSRGIKIIGATLTPFAVTTIPDYYSQEKESKRHQINTWIRTSHAFDGVIDFDKAVQDPTNPDHILPEYDSGDHLHPGDRGYEAMGNAIDLSLMSQ
jgi:lysophospholipase L1-like esterase